MKAYYRLGWIILGYVRLIGGPHVGDIPHHTIFSILYFHVDTLYRFKRHIYLSLSFWGMKPQAGQQ